MFTRIVGATMLSGADQSFVTHKRILVQQTVQLMHAQVVWNAVVLGAAALLTPPGRSLPGHKRGGERRHNARKHICGCICHLPGRAVHRAGSQGAHLPCFCQPLSQWHFASGDQL